MIKGIIKIFILNILIKGLFCQLECGDLIYNYIDSVCHTEKTQCPYLISNSYQYDVIICSKECGNEDEFPQIFNGYTECVKCEKRVFILSTKERVCEFSCPQDFPIEYFNFVDMGMYQCFKSPTECNQYFLLQDGKKCVESCPQGFYPAQFNGYKQCQPCDKLTIKLIDDTYICGTQCPEANQILDQRTNKCLLDMSSCLGFISLDQTQCLKSCPDGYVPYRGDGEYEPFVCQQCDKKALKLSENLMNPYICEDECPQEVFKINYYDIDRKLCVFECPKGYISDNILKQCYRPRYNCKYYLEAYISNTVCQERCSDYAPYSLDRNKDSFSECVFICDLVIYTDKDNHKRCSNTCPEIGQIPDFVSQTCITSIKECKGFVSTNQRSCLKECDFTNHQTSKQMDGYRQCVYCDGYLVYLPQISGYSCVQECPSGYLLVQKQKFCITMKQCTDSLYVISEDGTSCNDTCIFPEILQVDGKCLNSCKNNFDCNLTCPKDQYMQAIGQGQLKCSLNCKLNLSSNLQYCLQNCSDINEIQPLLGTKVCQACPQGEYPFQTQDGTLQCRQDSLTNIQNERLNFIKRTTINYSLRQSYFLLLTLKNIISNYETQQISLTQNKIQQKKMYDDIASYLQQGFKNSQNISIILAYYYYVVIENKDIGSIFISKNRDVGQKFSYKFNDESLKTQNLQEHIDLDVKDSDNVVVARIKNIYCTKDCISSHLFILYKFSEDIQQQRLLQEQSASSQITFTIDSSLKYPQRVVCVSYDDKGELITQKTTISNDKKSVTCQFLENSAYIYDEACKYLTQITCLEQELSEESSDSEDNSLSTGEIIGIVIGSFVIAVVIAFFTIRYYKKKNNKQNQIHPLIQVNQIDQNEEYDYKLTRIKADTQQTQFNSPGNALLTINDENERRKLSLFQNQLQITSTELKTINV